MLDHAETNEKRRKKLDRFFREAYALTFGIPSRETSGRAGQQDKNGETIPASDVVMVMRTSLSKNEFADALGMKPDSLFVKQMFNCVDKDKDGRISFQEFLDTVVMFSRGKSEDKLKVIFDMCDNEGDGLIDKEDLTRMLHSLVDIAKTTALGEKQVTDLIQDMFASVGLEDKDQLTWTDFKLVMKGTNKEMFAIGLDLKGANLNYLDTSNNVARMTSFQINHVPEPEPSYLKLKWNSFITYVEENRQHIFYMFIFYVATFVLFIERFYNYSYLSEHTDLRHVMGVGIAVTRGSAASLSFCYSLLLLTMCRNLITKIRECSLHQYIPLDSHVQFHKIVAMTGLVFTMIHVMGHLINFYHVSTQPLDHLKCLVKEMSFDSDNKPTFTFWIFGTVTGITGVMLFAILMIIYIFAHPLIRRKAYYYFWSAHSLYVLLYILSLFHGLAKLTGVSTFQSIVLDITFNHCRYETFLLYFLVFID
jgi:dual oxidase